MRKLFFLLSMLMTAGTVVAQSGATFTTGDAQTQNKRVSPNGRYIVCESTQTQEWGEEGLTGYSSFIWDLQTGEKNWLTNFNDGDYDKTGSFTDVTDNGVICGVMKDKDNLITWQDWYGTYTLPLNVAAVWQKDGTVTKLGLGTYTPADFKQLSDGTYAMAISNDAKTVVGFVSMANFATVLPVGWKYNEDTKKYDFKEYAMPEGYIEGRINDVSGDGRKAVGFVRKQFGDMEACWWPTPDECIIIENVQPVSGVQNDGIAFVISENGNFIGCTLNGSEPVVYSVHDGITPSYSHCGRHEGYNTVTVSGITNGGDLLGCYSMNGSVYRPFYYNKTERTTVDFDYFVYLHARDIQDEIPYTFTHYGYENAAFCGMSSDAKVIAGNDPFGAPWILTTEQSYLMGYPLTSPSIKVKATALGEITVTADKVAIDPYVMNEAREYVFYRDGKEVGRVAKADLGEDYKTVTFVDKGVERGTYLYSVAVNWQSQRDDSYIMSPKCEEVPVTMESTFAMPLFDNFDTQSIASNGWWVDRHYGDVAAQFVGCGPYFGLDVTSYLNYAVAQNQPYSYALVSRHMDARDKESVYMSFARYWEYVNSMDWEMGKDTLSVEVSVDDEKWESVLDMVPGEIGPWKWSFENVDLTPWAAGKLFNVRLRAHGQALAMFVFRIDNLRIDDKPAHEAKEDLMGINIADDNFRLTWKTSLDAYTLNYRGNYLYNVEMKALGNEGKELIAVNKFDAGDLKMYAGKYLTSVSTSLNYYETETTDPVRAAIVVYENGRLVREQELTDPEYNTYSTYKLDEPLQIKEGNELMIGLKLIEYPADQMPVLYDNTSFYVDGKSNLYSEDGGQTWLNLADFYEQVPGHETDGYGSWCITGNVTDTPEASKDERDTDEYAYEIYKNGKKYSDLLVTSLQGWFTDEKSSVGDRYQIRTYYFSDGTCSELSKEFVNDGRTGIVEIGASEDGGEGCILDGETLLINGDNERVALYNEAGMKLYEGSSSSLDLRGYGKGLLILKVWGKDGSEHSYKIMF